MKKLLLPALTSCFASLCVEASPIVVSETSDAAVLANTVVGAGVTINSAVFDGVIGSAGTFTGGLASGLGIERGIVLTSGRAMHAGEQNTFDDRTRANLSPGSSTLESLIPGVVTFDAATLTINFRLAARANLYFNYVFASEEYNEFVGSEFNDLFGFFLDGTSAPSNVALLPGTTTPVAINTVNSGLNPSSYRNNDPGLSQDPGSGNERPRDPAAAPFPDLQYDGFTTVLQVQALDLAAGDHSITIAIADAGDNVLDSGVFIQAGTLSILPTPPVSIPIADAGGPYLGTANVPFQLDGSASRGLLGSITSWQWDLDGDGAFDDANGERPQFTFSLPGIHRVGLRVTSSEPGAPVDTGYTTVEIKPATCITDLAARPKDTKVQLTWTHQFGATYNIYRSSTPNFTTAAANRIASNIATTYATYLDQTAAVGTAYFYKVGIVQSGQEVCLSTEAVITPKARTTGNTPPAANAGSDQLLQLGSAAQLDGTRSYDAERNPLSYAWSIISAPPGSAAALSSAATAQPTLLPDIRGEYLLQLIVRDAQWPSAPDTVRIVIGNKEPDAKAGPDQNAFVGQTVELDGSSSSDLDGSPISFRWLLGSRPATSTAQIIDANSARPKLMLDVFGEYELSLIVSDGLLDSPPDTLRITTLNRPPAAAAGPDQLVLVGETVTLDATGSTDPDLQPLTFRWSILTRPGGSAAALSDPTASQPTLVLDLPGTYLVQLIANDGQVDSQPDFVSINVVLTQVTVPSILGMTEAQAEQALIAVELIKGAVTSAFNPVFPAGQVISQNPTTGALVNSGSAVSFVLSLGPELFQVPNLLGLTAEQAEAALIAAQLVKGAVTSAPHATVLEGQVITQNPGANSLVPANTVVNFTLSAGPGQSETEAVIDPAGGTLTLDDGATLIIPPNSLTEATPITIRKIVVSAADADAVAEEGEIIYQFEPSGLTFAVPVLLRLPVGNESEDPEDLGYEVYTRNGPDDYWELADPLSVSSEDAEESVEYVFNEDDHTVSAYLHHFSQAKVNKKSHARTVFEQTTAEVRTLVKYNAAGQVEHKFPFQREFLEAAGTVVEVYKFIVTEAHKVFTGVAGTGGVWLQKENDWKTISLSPRNQNEISHIVMHDYGTGGTDDKPTLLPTPAVLRQVLLKAQKSFAEFYISRDGAIYQLANLDSVAPHAAQGNKRPSVGIELEPVELTGSFSNATLESAARLSAYLLKVLHLPFDPDIETLAHHPNVDDKYVPNGAAIGALPDVARNVTFVAHGEIQANRTDPRNFNWIDFLQQVSGHTYPHSFAGPGPLVDTSARNSGTGTDMDGGRVEFESIQNLDHGDLPLTELVVPEGANATISGGRYRKVYIGGSAVVSWSIGASDAIECGSFYLGRGATLRIEASSGGTATISAERSLQIDGFIDASGRGQSGAPASLVFRTGGGEVFRVPSFISRGANSGGALVRGGKGGDVTIQNGANSAAIIFGRGSHVPAADFPINYSQRDRTTFFAYGGNSFVVEPGRFDWPGIITSGGAGPGGFDIMERGGDGGNITILGGTSFLHFQEPAQFVSGAGYGPGISGFGHRSPFETLNIFYQQLFEVTFPAGGNGGRGRISFGNVRGGDGGAGGDAGNIAIDGFPVDTPITRREDRVQILNGGFGSYTARSIHVFSAPGRGDFLRVSAIGGSGGPRGGDSFFSFPGIDGRKGVDGQIHVFGTAIQASDPVGP